MFIKALKATATSYDNQTFCELLDKSDIFINVENIIEVKKEKNEFLFFDYYRAKMIDGSEYFIETCPGDKTEVEILNEEQEEREYEKITLDILKERKNGSI